MVLTHSVFQGFMALFRQKLRAGLTMLGMVIGICAVTVSVSVSEGLNKMVIGLLENMGMGNGIVCWRDDWVQRADGKWERNKSRAYLEYGDVLAIESDAPSVKFVVPENWWEATARHGSQYKQVRMIGTSPDYDRGHNWFIDRGRFLTALDIERKERVCVIGTDIERDLYKGASALGEQITIRGVRMTVVGVMEKKPDNSPDFTGTNNNLLLPLTTFQERFSGHEYVGVFFIRAKSTLQVRKAVREVKVILQRRHMIPDATAAFRFQTSDQIMEEVGKVSFVMKAFLTGVASIALVVGGVGIMNMMLVSVTERTYEIGLRKAVGAHRVHILYQFLIESLVLGTIGGVAGVGVGWGLGKIAAFAISSLLNRGGGPPGGWVWPSVVSLDAALFAMLVAGIIGVIAGILPAFRAAFLPPTDALRHV
ncbi:hypothetical protein CMK11_09815 [Candidatus Poribacteria bacterium]|nr:hypothetical protein [Candidatus Poribacteria bacterium]